jgi:hypothetical protein
VEGQEFSQWLFDDPQACAKFGCVPVVSARRSWRSLFRLRVRVHCWRCGQALVWDGVPGDDGC